MNKKELVNTWLQEEKIARIKGWDFSHINDRYTEETDLPWNYKQIIAKYINKDMKLLDMDTGGAEFLLTLHHPHHNTFATEGYKPNYDLCKEKLDPLNIEIKQNINEYPDNSFDIIINRHAQYDIKEVYKKLKSNGLFITQQIGALNDRGLIELLCGNIPISFPDKFLDIATKELNDNHFEILEKNECYRPIIFYDVAALVWFARIIEWEFIDFSVKDNLDNLFKAQAILEKENKIEAKIHRFYFVANKLS